MFKLKVFFAFCALSLSLSTQAALLYANIRDTTIPSFGNLDEGVVMLDDVAIPVDRLNGPYRIIVKKVSFDVYAPVAGVSRCFLSYTKAERVNNVVGVTLPPTPLTALNITSRANQRQRISIGNGVNPLFSIDLLPVTALGKSYGLFYFGLAFNRPLNNIGWVTAEGPDYNDNSFYGYYGNGDRRNGLKRFYGGVQASFNLEIEGDPVPEPATWVTLLALCGMCAKRRARRNS